MSVTDWIRYVMALMVVVFTPGAFLYWFVIHPFAPFWRRVGAGPALTAGLSVLIATAWAMWTVRHTLMAVDFGGSLLTAVPGTVLLVAAVAMRRVVSRQLKMSTLMGLPELAPDRYESRLIDQGIYARVRHPRYAQVLLAVAGYALVSNYLAAYGVLAFILITFAVLIPLEERELVRRFGPAYEDYRRRVPALLPRWPGR
jgi:protein-S-isoprenylcysteine O-methyltransferase Ste14